jgi:hypothetical protein
LVFLFLPLATRSIPYDTARATSASGNSVEILWKGLRGKERVLTMAADAAALRVPAAAAYLVRLLLAKEAGGGETEDFYSVGERKSGAAARVLS